MLPFHLPALLIAQSGGSTSVNVNYLLICVAVSIAVLIALIIVFRIHAFLALLASSMLMALLTGVDLLKIGSTIQSGMGGALGFIATVVGLGAILGKILEASGGAETIAKTLIRTFGENRATWALTLTGFIISIPVFLDVGLVLMAPLLFALARDTKKSVLYYGFPLLAGMVVTHSCIPPTPGPIAVAELLGAELGWVILFGFLVGLPVAILGGPILGVILARSIPESDLQAWHEPPTETRPVSVDTKTALPSFGLILLIIGLPLILMVCGSVVDSMRRGEVHEIRTQRIQTAAQQAGISVTDRAAIRQISQATQLNDAERNQLTYYQPMWKVVSFLGHPFVSLMIATFLAWYLLGVKRGFTGMELMELASASLGPAGIIILVTGAGGVFKAVLGESGAAQALAEALVSWNLPLIVLAYVISSLIRLIQGSATVAMTTAAGLLAGIIAALPQHPSAPRMALVVLAIAFGASVCSHFNDSGFWLVSRYLGMTERQTLQTWTVLATFISVAGLLLTMLIGSFVA